MSDDAPWTRHLRRLAPVLVAVVVGVSLAVFAGLSGDDASGGDGDAGDPPADEAPVDVATRLEATAAELEIPATTPVDLSPADPPTIETDGRSVELRVLVMVHEALPGPDVLEQLQATLDVVGIPYDVFHAETDRLTVDVLRDGDLGRYNGIVLTDSELLSADGASGLGPREWDVLEAYSRDFGVRQAVLGGFPTANDDVDYGMLGAEVIQAPTGIWTDEGADVFATVATDVPLKVSSTVFASTPENIGSPTVVPLLVDEATGAALISLVRHDDGREVLVSGLEMGVANAHSHALVYDFVRFATKGLHLGTARAHLAVHVDDLFLGWIGWDPEANAIDTEVTPTLPADIEAVVAMQDEITERHDTVEEFRVDFPFNGVGAALPAEPGEPTGDPLTDTVLANADRMRFINHTYQHRDLDAGAGAGAEEARIELLWNRAVWELLGLPGADTNDDILITGEHSGITDNIPEGDTVRFVPYPEGLNTAMAEAFEEAGVRFVAGDASQEGQRADQQVPGHDLILLPRHPTGVLLNAHDPATQVDQYNWFFHERHIEAGGDPCTIPAAVCEPVDYEGLLGAEADLTVRHMLSFRRWPHYFHMANVVDYDGQGSTVLGDWLEAVLTEYESRSTLPVENLSYDEIGLRTEAELRARAAGVVGVLDLETGEVVLAAGRDVDVAVTGLADGEQYGPLLQSTVAVGPTPTRFPAATTD